MKRIILATAGVALVAVNLPLPASIGCRHPGCRHPSD